MPLCRCNVVRRCVCFWSEGPWSGSPPGDSRSVRGRKGGTGDATGMEAVGGPLLCGDIVYW